MARKGGHGSPSDSHYDRWDGADAPLNKLYDQHDKLAERVREDYLDGDLSPAAEKAASKREDQLDALVKKIKAKEKQLGKPKSLARKSAKKMHLWRP